MARTLAMAINVQRIVAGCCLVAISFAAGCASTRTSNTVRTGTEQILISSAIDRAMSNIRFDDLSGQRVFVDDKYLDSVDKGYLIGSIRHRVLRAGGSIAAAADKADLVLEVRSGGVGTDGQESFVGIPAIGIPGMPIELPEIKLASRNTQMCTAKIGLVCYDAKTGRAAGMGGETNALTHNKDTFVMGIGPFRSGTVIDQRSRAIGYDGIRATLLTDTAHVAKAAPISLVEPSLEQPYSTLAQISTAPPSPNVPSPNVQTSGGQTSGGQTSGGQTSGGQTSGLR